MPPEEDGGSQAESQAPEPAPEQAAGAAPEIDLDACELDALSSFLEGNPDQLRTLADRCPRRVPPKARRSPDRLSQALLVRWAWPDARDFFRIRMTATLIHQRLRQSGLAAAAELADVVPPNAFVWWAVNAAACKPEEAYAALTEEDRALFSRRQELLRILAADLRRRREERYDSAEDARSRAARSEAERLTRQLRWRADQAEEKLRRAAAQVDAVAQDKEARIRELEGELAAERQGAAELQRELADVRAALEEAARVHHQSIAALRRQLRTLAAAGAGAATSPPLPLVGERVLVVGDDSHKVEYRRIVEGLGGAFGFHPGFEPGPRLEAALSAATVAVYVTAFASHKAQGYVRAAERTGLPVVTVTVAGAEAFRRALLAWCGLGEQEALPRHGV